MKQKLLNFTRLRSLVLLAVIAFLGAGQAWGADVLVYTLDGTTTGGTSAYDSESEITQNDISWKVKGNTTMNPWRIGGKSLTGVDREITSTTAMSSAITKVEISVGATASSLTVNSIKLVVASDANFATKLDEITKTSNLTSTTLTFTPTSGTEWATGAYYKIVFNVTRTSSSGNGYVAFNNAKFYKNNSSTPTCATPIFSPAAGVYTSAQSVTLSTETTDATIYYTTDGSTPTTSSTQYNGAINVSTTTTIKAIAVKDGNNNSSVASATYAIISHAGTLADPYTVADARAAIDANSPLADKYVTGIISQIDSYNSSYNSITYWISDDGTTSNQLEVYSGKGIDGADFSSADDIVVGASVVVFGTLKKYNSTYEFDYNNYQTSYSAPSVPRITADNVTLAYNATSGEIGYTVDNPTTGLNLSASSEADWISNITVGASSVTFTTTENAGNADRSATITLSYTGADDKAITVTQKHYVADYATLPFEFDGGKADIENTAGLTQDGLDSDYGSSPKLKFNSEGDYVILKINGRPGVLTFDIKGNPGGSPSGWEAVFKVQTSTNGTDWNDLKSYDDLTTTVLEESFDNINEDVRFIRWIYDSKTKGNVALGNIKLEAYVAPEPFDLTVTLNEHINAIFVFNTAENDPLIEDGAAGAIQVVAGTEIMVSPDVADGYVLESLTVGGQDKTSEMDQSGAYTFTMPGQAVTITATAKLAPVTVNYTLASNITSGKHYVIASGTSGEVKVMSTTQNNNNRGVADGSVSGTTLSVESDAGAAEVVIYGPDASGNYTIYDAAYNDNAGGYLYAISNNNYLRTQGTNDASGLWTISIDESTSVATVKVSFVNGETTTDRLMRYNSSNTIFSCYTTGQKDIYIYEKSGEATPTESKTLNASGYATYCSQNALDFSEATGGTAWAITAANSTTGVITFSQIEGSVPAGTGMLLMGTANGSITMPSATGATALSNNLLEGTTAAKNVTDGQYYGLSGNTFVPVNAGTVPAGKALLPASEVSSNVKSFTFVFEGADGIKTVEHVSAEEAAEIFNLAGQRLQKAQRGVNIINGKKVLVK